jgi:hypothetical protein
MHHQYLTIGHSRAVPIIAIEEAGHMIAMLHFVTLVIATLFAAAAALAFHWLLLRAAFLMMRLATARRIALRTELVRGTAGLARAYTSHR